MIVMYSYIFYETIVVTIVTSLLLFGTAQANSDGITAEKYHGVWYTMSATLNIRLTDDITCDWTHVTERHDDVWTFNEVDRSVIRGKFWKTVGYGKVENSEIHIVFPNKKDFFTVTRYNNDTELILHDKYNEKYHILLSHESTASEEANKAMEKHATDGGWFINHIHHDNCSYTYN